MRPLARLLAKNSAFRRAKRNRLIDLGDILTRGGGFIPCIMPAWYPEEQVSGGKVIRLDSSEQVMEAFSRRFNFVFFRPHLSEKEVGGDVI